MTIEISVRDYRGVERADIVLDPIALVAGTNEQGKSSLAEAVRAVLTGTPIVVAGVAKKDAKLLVRDGANEGAVIMRAADLSRTIEWPRCEVNGDPDAASASPVAVGLVHPLDMAAKERAAFLADYVDTEPTKDDVVLAAVDAGLRPRQAEQAWQLIETHGWDGALRQTRDHVVKQKGLWESVTGEKKWGPKKADGWVPVPDFVPGDVTALEAAVKEAEAKLEATIAAAAVSASRLADLRTEAAQLDRLERELADAESEHSKALSEWQLLSGQEPDRPKHQADGEYPCPKCGVLLTLDRGGRIVEVGPGGPTDAEVEAAAKQHAEWEAAVDAAHERLQRSTAHAVAAQTHRARQAVAELQSLAGKPSGASQQDVAAAREAMDAAHRAADMQRRWKDATTHHKTIVVYSALADILAPEGLRRRKMAAGLDALNQILAAVSESAGWPTVRFDEGLDVHYGTRPLWAASASGKWRARVAIQVALAQIDDSAAVVIDEADILDQRGRNGLFAMLRVARIPALVCMTLSRIELLPDLGKAGLGASYWMQRGELLAIAEAKEELA